MLLANCAAVAAPSSLAALSVSGSSRRRELSSPRSAAAGRSGLQQQLQNNAARGGQDVDAEEGSDFLLARRHHDAVDAFLREISQDWKENGASAAACQAALLGRKAAAAARNAASLALAARVVAEEAAQRAVSLSHFSSGYSSAHHLRDISSDAPTATTAGSTHTAKKTPLFAPVFGLCGC